MKIDRRTFLAGTLVAIGAKAFRWEPPPDPSKAITLGEPVWVDGLWATEADGSMAKSFSPEDLERLWAQLVADQDKPDIFVMSPEGYRMALEVMG